MASDSNAPVEQLLMVVHPTGCQAKRTVVRTINELQSPAKSIIAYHTGRCVAMLSSKVGWQLFRIQFIYENNNDVYFFVKVMN